MAALMEKPAFLLLVLVIVLLFGAKRLPELARGVGRSLRILRDETAGGAVAEGMADDRYSRSDVADGSA